MVETQILIPGSDAFCEHTMQQNVIAAGASPPTPLGSLERSPNPPAVFNYGKKGKGSGREEWKGRSAEIE